MRQDTSLEFIANRSAPAQQRHTTSRRTHAEVFSVLQTTTTTAEFEYCSPAGEMGYPGTLYARVVYEVDGGALRLRCAAGAGPVP